MLGALAGDLIGPVHEHHSIKTTRFPLFRPGSRFADDSVLTVAVADAILAGRPCREAALDWGRRYPRSGYGGAFRAWPRERDPRPCGSWSNGPAMRVGPVGWTFATENDVLKRAASSAAITTITPKGSKARWRPRWRSLWPAPALPRKPSATGCKVGSATA